ncbi:MAG TPA: hypothetical protein VGX16_04485 [Solirubrobacteraceae bacterium]|nr:hypothetical protein [Solirubrobacteraceae bacterium]
MRGRLAAPILALLAGLCLAAAGPTAASSAVARPTSPDLAVQRLSLETRLERADLVFLTHGLEEAQGSIHREVLAARAAWPAIVRGVPGPVPPRTLALVRRAGEEMARVRTPPFVGLAKELTGPAAGLAALLVSFEELARHGWTMTRATLERLSSPSIAPGAARFLRANAGLYIGSLYDAHYDLAAIGETLLRGYEQLGGPRALGRVLPRREVYAVARAYSPKADRLTPAPPGGE